MSASLTKNVPKNIQHTKPFPNPRAVRAELKRFGIDSNLPNVGHGLVHLPRADVSLFGLQAQFISAAPMTVATESSAAVDALVSEMEDEGIEMERATPSPGPRSLCVCVVYDGTHRVLLVETDQDMEALGDAIKASADPLMPMAFVTGTCPRLSLSGEPYTQSFECAYVMPGKLVFPRDEADFKRIVAEYEVRANETLRKAQAAARRKEYA